VGVPGTMTVTGNLAFQSGAFYIVQVTPGAAATTNVSGTAALAGTVGAIFLPGSYITRSYTILSAAGGRAGTFDALRTAGLPAGLAASLSYTGNAQPQRGSSFPGRPRPRPRGRLYRRYRDCRRRRQIRRRRRRRLSRCRRSPSISSTSAVRSTISSITAARCRRPSSRSTASPGAISPMLSFQAKPPPAHRKPPFSSPTSFST